MTKTAHPPKLSELDMSLHIGKAEYAERLKELQTTLRKIQQAYLYTGDAAIVVFEGWDAAGKGGTIRRMSSVLDPRGLKVWPIGAPLPSEKKHHYLRRFWERLPGRGEIAVFDRSWYGRVLVERVEGFASDAEWKRAYGEIERFEQMLVDDGTRVVKLFLYISQDEQLKRFQDRLDDPLKRWKLSYEDFRNRKKWDAYEKAADQMVARTHSDHAPWSVLPADSKRYARIAALEAITARLARGVDLEPRPLGDQVEAEAKKLLGWNGGR